MKVLAEVTVLPQQKHIPKEITYDFFKEQKAADVLCEKASVCNSPSVNERLILTHRICSLLSFKCFESRPSFLLPVRHL